MAAVGYATLPIIPSLEGIAGKLAAAFEKPAAASANRAAQSIEQAMKKAADGASYAVTKAKATEKKATEEAAAAQKKANAEYDKVAPKLKAIEAAEANLNKVRMNNESNLIKATQDLDKVRANSKSTVEDIERAELKLKAARDGASAAEIMAENRLTNARSAAKKAQDSAESSQKKYRDAQMAVAEAAENVIAMEKRLESQQAMTTSEFREAKAEAERLAGELGDLGDAAELAGEKSGGLGSKLMGGLKKVGTGVLLGVGAKIGATVTEGIGTAMDKGMGRLQSVEQAEKALLGLGNSAEQVEVIMDNAMSSVKGTAFGFGDAASMAGTLVASGIEPGEKLEKTLSLIGDSAAITGSELGDMGSIWMKIAAGGRMQTQELNQLMDRGLGLLPKLSEKYGVTNDEMRKMITEGKVSFEDFSEVMEDMVGGSAQAMGETFSGSAANMQASLGRLGAKFLDPVFSNAPAIFTAVGGAVDKLGEKVTPVIEEWSARLQPVFEDFANRLGPALESSIDKIATTIGDLIQKGQSLISWGQENRNWIEPLAVSVGVLVAAYKALAFQQTLTQAGGFIAWFSKLEKVTKVHTAVTKVATGVQKAFNLVINANKFMLVVTAIAAVVAGLTWFFTKTETGQKIWAKFTDFLSTSWDKVTSFFSAAWEGVLKPVFEAMWKVAQVTIGVIGTLILAPLMLAWQGLSTAFSWWFENVTKPVFEKFKEVAVLIWENFLQPVFTAIGDKWNLMSLVIQTGWSFIRGKWDEMAAKISELYNAFIQPIVNAIGDKWEEMKNRIGIVWNFIRDSVLAKFREALGAFKDHFTSVVDSIGKVWNGLKTLLAKPINFFIGTVYGQGIKPAWDTMAGFLPGLTEAPAVSTIPEYAVGGAIRGPGTGTSDDVLMWGSNGEHMWTAKEVREVGGQNAVYAMRNAVDSGRPFTYDGKGGVAILPRTDEKAGDLAGAAPDLLIPGFRDGGEIRPMWEMQLENGHRAAKSRNGNPYTWGFEDCSGYMSAIADAIINGGNGVWKWATSSFPGGQPFVPGLGAGFSVGVHDNPGGPGGGHTAGTLTGVGPYGTVNVESGGGHGYVAYGGPAAGADSPQFRGVHPGQFHLAIGADGAFESGGGGGGPSPDAMLAKIRSKIESTVDNFFSPILEQLPSPPPQFMGVPKAGYDTGKEEILGTAFDIASNLGDKLRTTYEAVKDLADLAAGAVGRGAGWVTDRARSAVGLHDDGGWLMPGALATNQLRRPEPVLTPSQWESISKMVAQMPVLGTQLKGLVAELEAQSTISWDERMQSLEDHLAGVMTNDKGEREQTRGRVGNSSEIAQWAGTEIVEGLGNEALGLVGLGGLISLPRNLDDDLRVAFEKPPADTPADASAAGSVATQVEPVTVASQASETSQSANVTINATFTGVDAGDQEAIKAQLDELATKVNDALRERRTAGSGARGGVL